jgi:hypothetical protein
VGGVLLPRGEGHPLLTPHPLPLLKRIKKRIRKRKKKPPLTLGREARAIAAGLL